MLLALGSLVAQEEADLREVVAVAAAAAILGDQAGYLVGRAGGRRAVDAFVRRSGQAETMRKAEAFALRWGAPGIFFSRWLVGALGPWINLSSGLTAYSWPRFLLWSAVGEMIWVGLYVSLGRVFSERVHDLAALAGNVGWLLLALIVAAASGYALLHELRRHGDDDESDGEPELASDGPKQP